MLQKTFSIYSEDLGDCRLFIEAGSRHIACWCKAAETGAVKAFEFFQFDGGAEKGIDAILNEIRLHSKLMDLPVSTEAIIWDNEEAICVPNRLYREDLATGYLDIMFGDKAGEKVSAQPLDKYIILSRQEAGHEDAFRKHFTTSRFTHKFSVLLQKYTRDNAHGDENRVYVIFYPLHFIVTAIKGDILQLIRSIDYSTAEDALYSIMHICEEHDMPLNTTAVIAAGLIDTTSNLYNTLYSYLEKFELEKSGETVFAAEAFAEYPAHYFLPFIQE